MAQDFRVWVFMPAGAQDGSSGRSQCIERLDLLDDDRTKGAAAAGIGFGEEIKGPVNAMKLGWTPDWIKGLPYTVHMSNEDLSILFAAEQDGDNAKQDAFWQLVEWLSTLDPKPLSIGLHGARLNLPKVVLDEHRYDWRIPHNDFLCLQDWHGQVVSKIRGQGLVPAIETVAPTQFVGPPLYGPKAVWVPMTYHEARIGAHPVDLCWLRSNHGSEIWVDLEHLFFALNFLNHQANYAWMTDSREWTKDPKHNEFVGRVGYAAEMAEIGRPPLTREPMDMTTAIQMMTARHLHVGGSLAEVVDIRPDEPQPPTEYIEGIRQVLAPYPGMFEETVGKRVGSHDSIYRTDEELVRRLRVAIACGAKTFLVETSGHTPVDCWYWARPDALEHSFWELLEIMKKLLA